MEGTINNKKIQNDWFLVWNTNVTIKLPPTASQEQTESSLEPTENVTLNHTQFSSETTSFEESFPSEVPTPA